MFDLTQDKKNRLNALCREYHVAKLSVFGSRLRGDDTEESDLDLLVEFEPGRTPGLKYFRFERELAELFKLKVDLNTPGFLSPYFRSDVEQSAQAIYAR